MTSPPSSNQMGAAARVLSLSPSDSEGDVRQCIGQLLESLDIEIKVEFQTPDGPADIYCPNRRMVIEAKAVGLAADPDKPQSRGGAAGDESPREQLERYLRAEMNRELDRFPFLGDKPWIGIVTDGRVWHAWRFPHQRGSVRPRDRPRVPPVDRG